MGLFLVTGGAGFIGSNITRALVARGDRVRVFDNFLTGRPENLADLPDVEVVRGDLRDLGGLRTVMAGVDCVLHQAALPAVPRSIRDPAASNESNVTGTLNVLLAARDAGVRRVVCASSSSVYGDTPTLPKVETMAPSPLSPYAVTKLAGEHYCSVFNRLFGAEAAALRYFNVFGPYQDPASEYAAVIPLFITAMSRGEQPFVEGDGTQSRDFTFVDNVVRANLLAAEAKGIGGEVFNIACGQAYTLLQLIAALNRILRTDLRPRFGEPRPGDVKHSQADVTKAKRMLGYEPTVSFEEGLERAVAWRRAQEVAIAYNK
ncbi:MAG TPA: SDR family oxidoreductase [Chloroflexota bacterium]|nr:SDR family oxidoreductase [Chloroflexota bacterium]